VWHSPQTVCFQCLLVRGASLLRRSASLTSARARAAEPLSCRAGLTLVHCRIDLISFFAPHSIIVRGRYRVDGIDEISSKASNSIVNELIQRLWGSGSGPGSSSRSVQCHSHSRVHCHTALAHAIILVTSKFGMRRGCQSFECSHDFLQYQEKGCVRHQEH